MHFVAHSTSAAVWDYAYSDEHDLLSIRRWLARGISPTLLATGTPGPGEAYIFPEPLEATFMRPALTIRLSNTGGTLMEGGAASPTFYVEHAVTITAYDEGRGPTVLLAQEVWRLLHGWAHDGASWSIPLWNIDAGARLARRLKVLRTSLAMGLDETDDEGKWSRPITLRVRSPRTRPVATAPLIETVATTTTVRA